MYELAGWSLNGPQRSPRAHFGPHFIRCNERKKMAKGAAAIFTVSGETIIKGNQLLNDNKRNIDIGGPFFVFQLLIVIYNDNN